MVKYSNVILTDSENILQYVCGVLLLAEWTLLVCVFKLCSGVEITNPLFRRLVNLVECRLACCVDLSDRSVSRRLLQSQSCRMPRLPLSICATEPDNERLTSLDMLHELRHVLPHHAEQSIAKK